MGKLKKYGFKFFLCVFTGMVAGIFIGTAGLGILVSYRIDKYHQKIRYLETVIEDKDIRLRKIEESIDKINKKRFILKEIEVILEYKGDEIDKITVEKHIKEKFTFLLGKEVKTIDMEMVSQVIDKRIFKIDEKEYRLKVTKVMLSEVLKIWVEIDNKE